MASAVPKHQGDSGNSEEGTSKGGPLTRVAKAFSFAKAVDLPEARGPLALVQAWNWGGIDY